MSPGISANLLPENLDDSMLGLEEKSAQERNLTFCMLCRQHCQDVSRNILGRVLPVFSGREPA